jgi:hypothetical protein
LSESPKEFKRVTPTTLFVAVSIVVVIQLGALIITNQNLPSYQSIVNETGYSYDPFGTSSVGAAGNAIFLVAFAFIATLALLWVLRRRMIRSFKILIFVSTALAAFFLTLVTADSIAYNYLPPQYEVPVSLGAAALAVILVGLNLFTKTSPWLSTIVLGFIGAEVGSFFAETLPPWTALALPIVFSVYDIYAVFRGPLKALIGTAPNIALVGMSIKAGEFTLGLGDIVFYTLLPCLALFQFGLAQSIYTVVAIDVGMVITLFLLSKRRLLPGLPIPMLLGISVIGLSYLL